MTDIVHAGMVMASVSALLAVSAGLLVFIVWSVVTIFRIAKEWRDGK